MATSTTGLLAKEERKRSNASFRLDAREGSQDIRALGLWGYRHRCLAATPVPMVPFLFAAGEMQYSVGKFLVALAVGRVVRYSFLAFLAAHYGRQVLTVMSQLGHPVLITVSALIAAAIALSFSFSQGNTISAGTPIPPHMPESVRNTFLPTDMP